MPLNPNYNQAFRRYASTYDAGSKLAKRTVSNVTPAVTTHYLYDPDGHVIAETTPAGVTTREYIWLGDMPVAVIDAVNIASPVTYFVHTDHLMRPLKMTDAAGALAWDAVWKPFGETFSITAAPKLDLGFPGQWTQTENGLAWNWRRHYDPTTGRYTKPDPLRFVDGPSVYRYASQRPNVLVDPEGEVAQIVLPIIGCLENPACVAGVAAATQAVGAYIAGAMNNPARPAAPRKPDQICSPPPPKNGCTCNCRARPNNNDPSVAERNFSSRFAIGHGPTCADAIRAAKAKLDEFLPFQAKHDRCLCDDGNGPPTYRTI